MRGRISDYIRHNAIGCVALFFALSGGVAWATHPGGANTISSVDIIDGEVRNGDLGLNAVGTDKINNGAVRSEDIRDGAVRSTKVFDESLTGADVDESSLGQVPSAGDADTVDGHHAVCPTGTQLYIGACWETQRRSEQTLPNAATFCGNDGRYLPPVWESREYAFDFRSGETGTILEWTAAAFQNGSDFQGIAVTRNGGTGVEDYQALHPYRCVAPLVR
jgi:hypothetical protein